MRVIIEKAPPGKLCKQSGLSHLRIAIAFIFLSVVVSCSNTSTRDLLDGNFLKLQDAPLYLIIPAAEASTNLTPAFAWSSLKGAISYDLQISETADFSQVVLIKSLNTNSYNFDNDDLIGKTSLEPIKYYWQVTAKNSTAVRKSKVGSFQVLAASTTLVEVYVDASFDPAKTVISAGNKSAPFRDIQSALEQATVLRNNNSSIPANIYVAGGTYNEVIRMKPNVKLLGGYQSSDWTRNYPVNVTTIQSTGVGGVLIADSETAASTTANTVVDGFTITATNGTGCTNVRIEGGVIRLVNNTITISCGANSGLILAQFGAHADIRNNTINGSTTSGDLTAINAAFGSTVNIQNNFIWIQVTAAAGSGIMGIRAHGSTGNTVIGTITNNIIYCDGSPSPSAYCIRIQNDANVTVNNNSVASRSPNFNIALSMETPSGAASTISVSNNIFFTFASGVRRAAAEFNASPPSPQLFANNLLFDATALYYNNNATSLTDTGADGILNGAPNNELNAVASCGTLACSYDNLSISGSTGTVFTAGFAYATLSTWQIKGNGPADKDLSGGWTAGDIGADISQVGPK